MNRKGFTLIELIVVLVILVMIMTIAIPSVTSTIERSKEKQKNTKIELIKSSAELYVDKHKNNFNENGKKYTIFIKDIVCDGILTLDQVADPMNEEYTIGVKIIYDKSSNSFSDDVDQALPIDNNLNCGG